VRPAFIAFITFIVFIAFLGAIVWHRIAKRRHNADGLTVRVGRNAKRGLYNSRGVLQNCLASKPAFKAPRYGLASKPARPCTHPECQSKVHRSTET